MILSKTFALFKISVVLCGTVLFLSAFIPDDKNHPVLKKTAATPPNWMPLLDNNLSKWSNYLAYNHKPDYAGKKPLNEKGEEIPPVGYNNDSKHVFTVQQLQGEPVLHISGEIYGCVFTKQEYANFHLKLQVKWGSKMYGPRVGKLKDSGILYYSVGESGVDYWRAWMLSQEFQVMQGHMGDYWGIASSGMDIRAYLPEGKMNSIADAKQPFIPFGSGSTEGVCIRSANYEKPDGEWNTLELVCFEGKSLHIVNGHVVMVLQNSRYTAADGKSQPLTKGKIQLQSEGCEVYYKNILIKNIKAMPVEYQPYFK